MHDTIDIPSAVKALHHGNIIAYPTEAVFGLGCDPFNEQAVTGICTLKERPLSKGLIVVAANWEQVKALTTPIPQDALDAVLATWPGPATWVFPASSRAPTLVCGRFPSIALRVSAHPTVKALCEQYGPIVSTSANLAGKPPAKTAEAVASAFGDAVPYIVSGDVGTLTNPTPIRDALTQHSIRQ